MTASGRLTWTATSGTDSCFGGDPGDGFDAELGSYGKQGRALGPVVGAFWEMPDDDYAIVEAVVTEELAMPSWKRWFNCCLDGVLPCMLHSTALP